MQVLADHKQLIAMRHAHPALRTGAYHRLHADDDSYVFARTNDDEALLVAINVAATPRNILVPSNGLFAEGSELEPVYGGSGARIEDGQVWLNLAGQDGLVLAARS
jgi:glycosidase